MAKQTMCEELFEDIMGNCLGGEINSDASVWGLDKHSIELHFWDGRRFNLTVTQSADGCAYSCKDGTPMSVENFKKTYG